MNQTSNELINSNHSIHIDCYVSIPKYLIKNGWFNEDKRKIKISINQKIARWLSTVFQIVFKKIWNQVQIILKVTFKKKDWSLYCQFTVIPSKWKTLGNVWEGTMFILTGPITNHSWKRAWYLVVILMMLSTNDGVRCGIDELIKSSIFQLKIDDVIRQI